MGFDYTKRWTRQRNLVLRKYGVQTSRRRTTGFRDVPWTPLGDYQSLVQWWTSNAVAPSQEASETKESFLGIFEGGDIASAQAVVRAYTDFITTQMAVNIQLGAGGGVVVGPVGDKPGFLAPELAASFWGAAQKLSLALSGFVNAPAPTGDWQLFKNAWNEEAEKTARIAGDALKGAASAVGKAGIAALKGVASGIFSGIGATGIIVIGGLGYVAVKVL